MPRGAGHSAGFAGLVFSATLAEELGGGAASFDERAVGNADFAERRHRGNASGLCAEAGLRFDALLVVLDALAGFGCVEEVEDCEDVDLECAGDLDERDAFQEERERRRLAFGYGRFA